MSVPVCPMPTLLCQNDLSVIMDAHVKESADAPFLSQIPHRLCFPLYACDQDMGTKLQQSLSIRATTSAVDGEPQKMLNLLATDGSQEGSSAERSADLSVLTNLNDGSRCCFLQCRSTLEQGVGSTALRIPDDGRSEPPRIERISDFHSFAQGAQYLCSNATSDSDIQAMNGPVDSRLARYSILQDFQPNLETSFSKRSVVALLLSEVGSSDRQSELKIFEGITSWQVMPPFRSRQTDAAGRYCLRRPNPECSPSILCRLDTALRGATPDAQMVMYLGNRARVYPCGVTDGLIEAILGQQRVPQFHQKLFAATKSSGTLLESA